MTRPLYQTFWLSGIRLPLRQFWDQLGAPKIDSRRTQNNARPAVATHYEQELIEMHEIDLNTRGVTLEPKKVK